MTTVDRIFRVPTHLTEWIEYHRMMGVQHFLVCIYPRDQLLIFVDTCHLDASSDEVLAFYKRNGTVTMIDWCPYSINDTERSMQNAMILDCLYLFESRDSW